MQLFLRLWGNVSVTMSEDADAARFSRLVTDSNPDPTIRIEKSDWVERILPGLGYDKRLLIDLPLPQHPAAPDEIKEAVRFLELARQQLNREQYRPAVHSCREAKDALIK